MRELQGFQVLLVEDNPDDLWLMGEILRSRGHTVTACQDAESAWTAFEDLRPRLLILDYMLPGMDGLELCRKIREHPHGSECVVVVVTARNTPADLKRVLEAGADDYLAKPVDVGLLEVRLAVAEQRVRGILNREANQGALGTRVQDIQTLMENLDEVFFSLDPQAPKLTHVSPAAERLMGIPTEEILAFGSRWREFFCPPELREGDSIPGTGFESGILSSEFEITRPDGETRWVLCTLNPTWEPSGRLSRLTGLLTDLTARRHIEEELSARNLELHTLNQILGISLASPDLEGALPGILDSILAATDFPCAFLTHLDQERDQLRLVGHRGMPRPPEEPVLVPLNETLGGIAVERQKPVAVDDARNHSRYRNDFLRRQKFRSYVAFPLVASGRVLGVLTLADPEVREISMRVLRWGESLANILASFLERLDAERALREGEAQAVRLAQDLKRANEELETFAYSVSHDLRAPLRTMQGFAHALIREYGDALPPEGRDFARRIIDSGRQAEDLIRDLLAYSRMSFEKLELQDVSLDQVLSDALEQVEGHIRERDATVISPKSLPTVLAHHTTLVQVLANLLTNAVKFVPEERRPEVKIQWEDSEDKALIRLWVEDNGIGVPPDQQSRIFNAFERLEGGITSEGTGIGLAIVRRGMQRIRGDVGVISRDGTGSRFWLDIPKSQPTGWRPWVSRRTKGG